MGTDNRPLNDEQILALWNEAKGHAVRFARLIESFHGVRTPDCGGAQHSAAYYDTERNK